MEKRSTDPTRDIPQKKGVPQEATSPKGLTRLIRMAEESLHIGNKELFERTLGGDYYDRLSKKDRMEAIDTRFCAVHSYIQENWEHVGETDRQQFPDLVKRAMAGEKAARASKSASTKEQRYSGERDYRNATRDLVTMEERLKQGLKCQAEEDFHQLMHSPGTDATRIVGNLEKILHQRIKEETRKRDIIEAFGEFIQEYKKLHTMYESIEDYYECKKTFQMTEEKLSFEEVDDMRAKMTKGYRYAEALMRNGQSPQRILQDFANEQVKKLDGAIKESQSKYNQIDQAKKAKNHVELEYLNIWIQRMKDSRKSMDQRAIVFKDDSQTFFKDASNLTLAELKTSLKGFLWDQLDPKRARQGRELFIESYNAGPLEWRKFLGGRGEYGVDAQLMFIGQRSMTYHETRLIQKYGGEYFFTATDIGGLRDSYSFVRSTAKMMVTAYPVFHPDYDSTLPISSYLQELPRPWMDFSFGADNSPDARHSYRQQGLLFGFPDGAIRTFINHHMAYGEFCDLALVEIIRGREDSGSEEVDIVSMDATSSQDSDESNYSQMSHYRGSEEVDIASMDATSSQDSDESNHSQMSHYQNKQERKLLSNFIHGMEPPEGVTEEEQNKKDNEYRKMHQEEVRTFVTRELSHLSKADQQYLIEQRVCYRPKDMQYWFMESDNETVEDEQHVWKMLDKSGIKDHMETREENNT